MMSLRARAVLLLSGSMPFLAGCGMQMDAHTQAVRVAAAARDERRLVECMDVRVVNGSTANRPDETAMTVVRWTLSQGVRDRGVPLGGLLGRMVVEAQKRGALKAARFGDDYVEQLLDDRFADRAFATSEIAALAAACDACISHQSAVMAARKGRARELEAMLANTSPPVSGSLCRDEDIRGTQPMDVASTPEVAALLEKCGATRRSPDEHAAAVRAAEAREIARVEEASAIVRAREQRLRREQEEYQARQQQLRERAAFDAKANEQRYRLEHGIPEPKVTRSAERTQRSQSDGTRRSNGASSQTGGPSGGSPARAGAGTSSEYCESPEGSGFFACTTQGLAVSSNVEVNRTSEQSMCADDACLESCAADFRRRANACPPLPGVGAIRNECVSGAGKSAFGCAKGCYSACPTRPSGPRFRSQ